MAQLEWRGEGSFTDAARGFTARPGTKHDFDDDERVEQYLDHVSELWHRVDTDETSDGSGTDASADDDLQALEGVGESTADELAEKGYGSFDAIREASVSDLAEVKNVSADDAESFHEQLTEDEE